jgi:hypothetical protein
MWSLLKCGRCPRAPKMRQRLLLKAGIFDQARTMRITVFLFEAKEVPPDVRVMAAPSANYARLQVEYLNLEIALWGRVDALRTNPSLAAQ